MTLLEVIYQHCIYLFSKQPPPQLRGLLVGNLFLLSNHSNPSIAWRIVLSNVWWRRCIVWHSIHKATKHKTWRTWREPLQRVCRVIKSINEKIALNSSRDFDYATHVRPRSINRLRSKTPAKQSRMTPTPSGKSLQCSRLANFLGLFEM